MIIVDTREFKSRVVKELFNNDVEMQALQLQVGDYLIGEDLCVERKSVNDFVDSLIDKRLFEQLSRMKSEYRKPLLIVEGGESVYSARKVHPNAIKGLIISIIVDYGIPILFSRDEADTAGFLISLVNRSEKKPKPLSKKVKSFDLTSVQENIVQAIPGIGVKAGKNLLKHFKKIKILFNAEISDLSEVEGVGRKTAEALHKAANKEYED
ncbi:MAG: hypothetical protein JW791_03780 [Nanoarchaeota archaeon]|nr:hypothetical protein [Nanoarchaeota archaeon]